MKKQKRTFRQNRIFIQNSPLSPRICPELAAEIGLAESILLLQYEFWIATEGEEREGQLWIRKTIREIRQVFSFWGTSTINRLINKLVDGGYLISAALDEEDQKNGRWLRFGFDRLATLTSIKVICAETGQTICAILDSGLSQDGTNNSQNGTNNRPSPYIDPKSIKREEKAAVHLTAPGAVFHGQEFNSAWDDYKQHRKEKSATLTPTAERNLRIRLLSMGEPRATAALRHSIAQGWTGVFEEDRTHGKSGNGNGRPTPKKHEWQGSYYAEGEHIEDDGGDRYTIMHGGMPVKQWRTPEAFAADKSLDVEKVRAGWNC